MPTRNQPVLLATRGSPLALAQTNLVLAECRARFPDLQFELKVIKTTGDKLRRASLANPASALPKGLFTKELELALLNRDADLAVHSLKDLPTDLPAGLTLGAVSRREDPRDVLIFRAGLAGAPVPANATAAPTRETRAATPEPRAPTESGLTGLPAGAHVATSSTRRREQLLGRRPDLRVSEIRGNVGTRLQKLAGDSGLSATILAAAGLVRLGYKVQPEGELIAPPPAKIPEGLLAHFLDLEVMLPCVGQGAIGIEIREADAASERIARAFDHAETHQCVVAERAFLRAMGGGCQSPVAAYADLIRGQIRLRAVSFRTGRPLRGEVRGPASAAEALGAHLADQLRAG